MNQAYNLKKDIFSINSSSFEAFALKLFRYQALHNPVYNNYINYRNINPNKVKQLKQIPFLPIQFFKQHQVITHHPGEEVAAPEKIIFESSGTSDTIRSRHYVYDLTFYEQIATHTFESFYGSLGNFHILALLPSYLERKNASLVYMVRHFINRCGSPHSGFFLDNYDALTATINKLKNTEKKIMLIGVSFALLDLAEKHNLNLNNVVVMETGGMKGRRKELIREELHDILKRQFHSSTIHSEYGMTELLSQAYAQENGMFKTPPWMKILIRDINDPYEINNQLRSGGINVIDLANIDSCAFIETRDVGKYHTDSNAFEVLGRFDNSDIRGCNLMVM